MASKSLKTAMNAVERRAPEKFDEKPLVDIAVRGRDNRFKKSDEKRLVKFVNAIARHSPFGRAVLEDAAKGGYTLIMESQKGTCGYCDKESKILSLNPRLTDELLVATLAHEGRHAQQFVNGGDDRFGVFNLKSELMYQRAMEADAEAAAAATCHEIKVNSGNAGPWNDFADDSVEIAAAFRKAARKPDAKVSDKMLQAAFNAWYTDIDMVEGYEEGYVTDVMKDAMVGPKNRMPRYSKQANSADTVQMFCRNAEGKCYWADNLNVLENEDKLSICAKTYKVAKKFFAVREMKTGRAPDPTLETLKVRDGKPAERGKRNAKTQINGFKLSVVANRAGAGRC